MGECRLVISDDSRKQLDCSEECKFGYAANVDIALH